MAQESRRFEMTMEVSIHGFAFGGRAVGRRPDGKVCFVRGGIPGEKVRVKLTADKKNYSEGVLEEVLTPSDRRLVPECPNRCPGCSYAHIPYEMELEWKQRQFRSFAEKAHLQSRSEDFLRDPVGAPVRTGWRNKIRLSLEFAPDGTVRAGYRDEDNRTLIPVTDCPLAVPPIREELKRGDWRRTLTGKEKTVTFRWTEQDGVRVYCGKGGKSVMTDQLSGFGAFQVGEGSFFQINPYMSGKLAAEVLRLTEGAGLDRMVELYCGCGCFSILCAEKLPALRTFGIELDAGSIRCARENADRHGVSGRIVFAAGDCGKVFRQKYSDGSLTKTILPADASKSAWDCGKVFRQKYSDGFLTDTLLLIDPPRTGSDPAVLDLICRSKAAGIIYVSCSPDTLFRDLAKLETAGYRIRESRLLDLFPTTAHFESVTFLEMPGSHIGR